MFAVALSSEEHFEVFSQKLSEVKFIFRSRLFNENLEFLYSVSVLVRMQNGALAMKDNMELPQKIKNKLPYDREAHLLHIYPKELKSESWSGISTYPIHKHCARLKVIIALFLIITISLTRPPDGVQDGWAPEMCIIPTVWSFLKKIVFSIYLSML